MITLKESLIVREYIDRSKHIQIFKDIDASSTYSTTYSPPKNYIFMPLYVVSGSQTFHVLRITAKADGTTFFENIKSTDALKNVIPVVPISYAKTSLTISIENTDVVSRTADLIIVGFLIRDDHFDKFIEEITGRKDRAIMERIEKTLLRIEKLLGGERRRRE